MLTAFEKIKQKSESAQEESFTTPSTAFERIKQKSGVESAITPQKSQEMPTLRSFVAKDVLGQAREEDRPQGAVKGVVADMFRSSLGSEGATGLASAPARPFATAIGAKAQVDIQEGRKKLSDTANEYIRLAQSEQDPSRKKKLLSLAGDALRQGETLSKSAEEVNKATPQSTSTLKDLERIGGQSLNTALTFAPFGKTMQAGKVVSAIPSGFSAPLIKTALQTAGVGARTARKVVKFGKNIVPRVIESAGFGAGFGAGTSLAREESTKEVAQNTLIGAGFGTAFPIGGQALRAISVAPGNVLIKMAKSAYQRALKPSLSKKNVSKIPSIVATGIREGIVLSERGVEKTARRIEDMESRLSKAIDKSAKIKRDKAGNVISRGKNVPTIKTEALQPFIQETKDMVKNISDVEYAEKALENIDAIYTNFVKKYGAEVPIDVAQEIKTATYRWLKDAYGEISSPVREANKQLVRGLKEGIVDIAPQVQGINDRLKKLYEFDRQLERSSGRISNLNLLGLGGKIFAASSVAGNNKIGIVLALIDKFIMNPGAVTTRAIVYDRVGRLLNRLTPAERLDAFANRPVLRDIYERFTGTKPKGESPKIPLGLSIKDVSKKLSKKGFKEFIPDNEAYHGYAKQNKLDIKGLNDKTVDWLDTWQNIDIESNAERIGKPPVDVISTLRKFRPTKPVKLYRGVPKGGEIKYSLSSKTGFESWTYDKNIARKWAGKDGNVQSKIVNPNEILVDYGKLPKDYFDINGNVEREVIVKLYNNQSGGIKTKLAIGAGLATAGVLGGDALLRFLSKGGNRQENLYKNIKNGINHASTFDEISGIERFIERINDPYRQVELFKKADSKRNEIIQKQIEDQNAKNNKLTK